MLNSICWGCACFCKGCKGTENQVWTGCISRKPVSTDDSAKKLRRSLEMLALFEDKANKADAAYEADPMNEEKEAAFDAAYKNEYNAFMAVSELIVEMTNGQIDFRTAREMVRSKRNDLLKIVA